MPISQIPDTICMPNPSTMPTRGSARFVNMAAKNPASTPMPRQLTMMPTSESGNFSGPCSSGGSSTIGVKFSMPKMAISSRPMA